MRTFNLAIIAFLLLSMPAAAQQLAAWSQFRSFNYTFNPAAVEFGEEGDFLGVDLAYRRLWTGFEDAPQTALAGFRHTSEKSHMSFGGFLTHDRFGPTSYTQAQAQYAYQLQFDYRGDHVLSIGLGVGASQFRLDGAQFDVEDNNDLLLADALQTQVSPTASLGLFYHNQLSASRFNPKYLFAGLSAEQAIPADVTFERQAGGQANLKRELHYHAILGARFYYGNGYDYVEPVAWGKLALYAPVNLLMGTRMTFSEQRFWGGLAVSSAWEGYFQFGLTVLDNWRIGYANSLFLARTFSAPAGMSHEVSVSFRRW